MFFNVARLTQYPKLVTTLLTQVRLAKVFSFFLCQFWPRPATARPDQARLAPWLRLSQFFIVWPTQPKPGLWSGSPAFRPTLGAAYPSLDRLLMQGKPTMSNKVLLYSTLAKWRSTPYKSRFFATSRKLNSASAGLWPLKKQCFHQFVRWVLILAIAGTDEVLRKLELS